MGPHPAKSSHCLAVPKSVSHGRSPTTDLTLSYHRTRATSLCSLPTPVLSPAYGAFSPTDDACASLRLTAEAYERRHHGWRRLHARADSLPPSSAQPSQNTGSPLIPKISRMATDGDTPSPTSSTTTLQDVAEVDSVEPAGPTVSTKAHDLIHPLPPFKTVPDDQAVAGFPSSPRRHVRFMSAAALHHSSDMNPILAKLERKSRLCAQSLRCATCGRRGAGFPKCPRCGDSWCSRECRLFGGKRHACAKK